MIFMRFVVSLFSLRMSEIDFQFQPYICNNISCCFVVSTVLTELC